MIFYKCNQKVHCCFGPKREFGAFFDPPTHIERAPEALKTKITALDPYDKNSV